MAVKIRAERQRKVMAKVTVRLRAYDMLCRAVEEGVAYGWRRAHKHGDKPGEEAIRGAIEDAVTNALCEVLAFDDGEE